MKSTAVTNDSPVNLHTIKSRDQYLQYYEGWRAQTILELRRIILTTVPKAQETIRWMHPVYELNGPFCFLKAYRGDVRLGFWQGDQLQDPLGLLVPPNEGMRYVRCFKDEPIDQRSLEKLLKAAVRLNKELGESTSFNKLKG